MRRRLGDGAGQTTVEWLALLVALVALAGVLAMAGRAPAGAIVDEFARSICHVGGGCEGSTARPGSARGARAAATTRRAARALTARGPGDGPFARAADVPPRGDRDDDGLSDAEERRLGTSPHRADTDGDGLNDGEEAKVDHSDPIFRDTDHDGLSDREEVRSGGQLDPRRGDTDGDGLRDAEELAAGTKPDDADSDNAYGDLGDGLSDADELRRGTDPTRYDTDGDGDGDGWEVRHGRDPRRDERNPVQKIFDDILDHPFDYLLPGGLIRGAARDAVERIIRRAAPKLKDVRAVKTVAEAIRLRQTRVAAVRRLTRNKVTGDAARDRIAARNPDAHTEVTLDTPLGPRRVDVLTADQRAIESKVGRTALKRSVRRQIAKDVMLRRMAPERVRTIEWHFATSPRTGRIGPTRPLERELRRRHIKIVYDP